MFTEIPTQKVAPDARTNEFGIHPPRGGLLTLDVDLIDSDGNPEVFLYVTNLGQSVGGIAIVKGVDGKFFPVPVPIGGIAVARGVAVVSSGNVTDGNGGFTSMSTTPDLVLGWLGGA